MKNNSILIVLVVLLFVGCVDQTQLGESSYNKVLALEIENQSGSTVITDSTITVTISSEADRQFTTLRSLSLSNFASTSIAVGDTLDCRSPYAFTVIAEDGSARLYHLIVSISSGEEQIDNSNFESWYQLKGGVTKQYYYQPGESADKTIWATANEGLVMLSVNDTNTIRYITTDATFGVKMKTIKAPAIVRIAAATIFTGTFDKDAAISNPTDPHAAVHFGTPFTSRPKSVSFRYKYTPGADNLDSEGKPVGYADRADIYMLLEVRQNSDVFRLGTAWFRGGAVSDGWIDTTLTVTYGELPNDAPSWEIPENGKYAASNSMPTHLSFVASSSCRGDFFEGAIGSELLLDNVVLNY